MISLLQLSDYNDLFHAILNIHQCGGEINIDIAALCTGYCNSCLKFNDIQCPNITPIRVMVIRVLSLMIISAGGEAS